MEDGTEGKVTLSLEEQELQAAQAELVREQDPEAAKAADEAKAKSDADAKAAEEKAAADAKAKADAEAAGVAAAVAAPAAEKTVPLAALYKERKARQAAEHANAVLTGQVQALSHVVAGAKAAPDKEVVVEKTAEERITEIEAERLALAEKFDAAEISATEMRKREIELGREERSITLAMAAAASAAAAPQPAAPATDLQLEEATEKLGTDYPILNVLTVAQLLPFEEQAYADAEAEGKPIQQGARGTLELRSRIAELANAHYSKILNVDLKPKATAIPAKAGLSPAALAREAKIAAQDKFPPEVSKLGSAATGEGLSEAQLEAKLDNPNLSEAEAEALLKAMPPSVRRSIGGISG